MSSIASGNESGIWNAVLRWVEPLMLNVNLAAEDDAEFEMLAVAGTEAVSFSAQDEDAERWDGLS